MLEVAIAFVHAGLVIVMAYLGVHVTLHPQKTARSKRRYQIAFVCCAVGAISLDVWQQYSLGRQLSSIEQNTKQPPRVEVNIPSPTAHTHLDFVPPQTLRVSSASQTPFRVGQVAQFNLGLKNAGDSPAVDSSLVGTVEITEDASATESAFDAAIKKANAMTCGTLLPRAEKGCFLTYPTTALTKEQVAALNKPSSSAVCLLGRSSWHDDSGNYHADFLQCLRVEPSGEFQWHIQGSNHNRETKD